MAELTDVTKRSSDHVDAAPTDALKEAGQRLLSLLMQHAAQVATERVSDLSDRLTDYAEHGGPGLKALLSGGKALAEGRSPLGAALSGGTAGVMEKVKGLFGGGGSGGGGGKKLKVTNIVESIDVGLPLRTTYNLWTQFTDFPSFMKKVERVEQQSDEKTTWQAQVFWSRRSWEATILEQVPDSHIVWRSEAEKGRVDGAVSFTALGPNLTRVLIVLEYWPKGFFEQTGNLWRAQGRRARLEIKHFYRHALTSALLHQEEIEGWRGEIRDAQVVRSHEDAMASEDKTEDETEGEAEDKTADEAERAEHESDAEDYAEDTVAANEDEEEDDYSDTADEEDNYTDEDEEDEYSADEEDDYPEEEDDYVDTEANRGDEYSEEDSDEYGEGADAEWARAASPAPSARAERRR